MNLSKPNIGSHCWSGNTFKWSFLFKSNGEMFVCAGGGRKGGQKGNVRPLPFKFLTWWPGQLMLRANLAIQPNCYAVALLTKAFYFMQSGRFVTCFHPNSFTMIFVRGLNRVQDIRKPNTLLSVRHKCKGIFERKCFSMNKRIFFPPVRPSQVRTFLIYGYLRALMFDHWMK